MEVAEDQRARGFPRDRIDRLEVGPKLEVAESSVPICQREPVLWLHPDIDREEIIAAVRRAIHELTGEAIAGETFTN